MKYIPANLLTLFRVLLAGVAFWLIFNGEGWMVVLALLAGAFTDIFDGQVARWMKAETRFGYVFDHVADRFLLAPCAFLLYLHLPLFLVIMFFLVETATWLASWRMLRNKVRVEWPNWPGRLSFVFAVGAVVVLLTSEYLWWAEPSSAFAALMVSVVLRLSSLFALQKSLVFARRES